MSSKVMKDVKKGKEIVGQVEVPVFDNLDEAEEELGEQKCVEYVNRALSIELMDSKRREAAGGGFSGTRGSMPMVLMFLAD